MSESISLTCQIISGFSLLANFYLLYIYFVCPVSGVQSYKYSFLITALQNIVLALCMILIVPVPVSSNFTFALIAVGPLRAHSVGQYLVVIYIHAYMSSLMIVTNCFVYRYIHICKINWTHFYQSAYGKSLEFLLNIAILSVWAAITFICVWPNPEIVDQAAAGVYKVLGIDSHNCSQLCFSLEKGMQDPIKLCLFTSALVLLSSMVAVMVFATITIHGKLKEATISENVRKMQNQLLTLLLVQTACPLILLHMPCMLSVMFMYTGIQTSFSTYAFVTLSSLYPLISPFVIIVFLSDYRNHTTKIFRSLREKHELVSRSIIF